MSNYINPLNESKEDFINREAVEISREEFVRFNFLDLDNWPVCLVQNSGFSACVVAKSSEDTKWFADPNDGRPKRYFLIERFKVDASILRDYI